LQGVHSLLRVVKLLEINTGFNAISLKYPSLSVYETLPVSEKVTAILNCIYNTALEVYVGTIQKCSSIQRAPSSCNTPIPSNAVAEDTTQWAELWSRLHLLVLQTLMAFPSLPGARQLELVTLADMNQTVKDVVVHVKMIPGGMKDPLAMTAVNRLVQVLQVALATGAFRCSLSKWAYHSWI